MSNNNVTHTLSAVTTHGPDEMDLIFEDGSHFIVPNEIGLLFVPDAD